MKSHKQLSTIALLSLLVLAGCTASDTPANTETTPVATPSTQDTPPAAVVPVPEAIPNAPAKETSTVDTETAPAITVSKDIMKTEELSYTSPAGPESIRVTVVTKDGVITEASATPLATHEISLKLQTGFSGKVSESVVGKAIKGLKVDTVSGASLTTAAFNEFIAKNAN